MTNTHNDDDDSVITKEDAKLSTFDPAEYVVGKVGMQEFLDSAIENRDTAIMMRDKKIAQQNEHIAQQKEHIAQQIEQIEHQNEQIAQQEKALLATAKALKDTGMPIDQIADMTNLPLDKIQIL